MTSSTFDVGEQDALHSDSSHAKGSLQPSYGAAQSTSQEEGPIVLDRWLNTDAKHSFWLSRLLLLRCMGAVYFFAFLTSGFESRQLLGPNGLMPAKVGPSFTGGSYLFDPSSSAEQHIRPGSRPTPAFALLGLSDVSLAVISWFGCLLSLLLVTGLCTSFVAPATLWILWLSIVNLGSEFIANYGWEWQVCEVGFLICFLCHSPLKGYFWRNEFPVECPPPYIVLFLLRWMCFRVMIGAGLSKIDPWHWRSRAPRGSECWADLTCTATHYETTGAPNPLGYFMHKQPMFVHMIEVALNHFVELLVPWLFLVPIRDVRLFAASISLFFMACISCTGNYSYINHITAVPMIACLDDSFLSRFFQTTALHQARLADEMSGSSKDPFYSCIFSGTWPSFSEQFDFTTTRERFMKKGASALDWLIRHVAYFLLLFMITSKSVAPLQETFGPEPWLNHYDDYFFVNAYGVFGFVNKIRIEMVLSYLPHGSDQSDNNAVWKPLDFHCKPSSIDLMPCIINPYHDRFDWFTWIRTTCGLENMYSSGGAEALASADFVPPHVDIAVSKILKGDTDAASLFGTPVAELFQNGHPPQQVRAELYRYEFSDTSSLFSAGEWWKRTPIAIAGDGNSKRVGLSQAVAGQISQKSPNHDFILLASTFGILLAILGLHDQNVRDAAWRPLSVMLGSFVFISGLLRPLLTRTFVATWVSLLLVLLGAFASGSGPWNGCKWFEFACDFQSVPLLPPVLKKDDQYYLTQFRRFRVLNGVLLVAFLATFAIGVESGPGSGGYCVMIVLAVIAGCAVGLGIRHTRDYIDGACLGGCLVLAALVLEAAQAATFRPPSSP